MTKILSLYLTFAENLSFLLIDSRVKELKFMDLELGLFSKIRAFWIQAPCLIYPLQYYCVMLGDKNSG
ncbi:unnamed protein product [Spirodela intermedia]|uniref:Uncharacterized protein n=1 Tax=Spirodela intermedia TaxID=51605 RepID=A0A7I8L3I2_SPIIN|nr:unnamed protein product [Spirodela intermedia]